MINSINKTLAMVLITTLLCFGISYGMYDKDLFVELPLKSSGAHESSTGAPGEKTCTQSGCHDFAEIKTDDTTNTLIVGDSNGFYSDEMSPIRLRVKKANTNKFGFQIVCLDTLNRNAGTWFLYSRDYVQTQNADFMIPAAVGRKYLTHTYKGNRTTITGEMQWDFAWIPPSNGYKGKVTFYVMTNCSNDDNNSGGDTFYASKHEYFYKAISSVKANDRNTESNAQFIPELNQIIISGLENVAPLHTIELIDAKGKVSTVQNYSIDNQCLRIPRISDYKSSGIILVKCMFTNGINSLHSCLIY